MAEQTEIAWCDSTFNPWIGCTKVSPGCDHCYAERDMDHRRGRAKWGAGQPRSRTSADYWKQPLRWNRQGFMQCQCGWRGATSAMPMRYTTDIRATESCPACGKTSGFNVARRRVFCASLADVFDNEVDSQWRRDLFNLIRATPNLDWLLLTKRIGIAQRLFDECHDYLSDAFERYTWPENVWLGATVVNQEEANRDVPKLLSTSAPRLFVSIEPMLGPVVLTRVVVEGKGWHDVLGGWRECADYPGRERTLDWVICGGESGPGARPVHPQWLRWLRNQCASTGVPFLFKQWGAWVSVSEVEGAGPHHQFPDGATVRRLGKKAAGRTLDGAQHDGFPA